MKSYTVHIPPGNRTLSNTESLLEKAVFIVDRFSPIAALVPPLWLLWHRQWLGLGLYCVLFIALAIIGFWFMGWALTIIYGALAIGFGLEASSLRRWRLAANGWQLVDAFTAADLPDAEERFFSRFKATHIAQPQEQRQPKPAHFKPASAHVPQIIGFS